MQINKLFQVLPEEVPNVRRLKDSGSVKKLLGYAYELKGNSS